MEDRRLKPGPPRACRRSAGPPGTGEIHYPAIVAALDRLGYAGVVGLEGWASGDADEALARFRAAFTV